MYSWEDLTPEEQGKIKPGLQQEIQKWYNLPGNVSIVELDKQDKIDADVVMILNDGNVYYIVSNDLPASWTKYHWADFVVRVIKGQNSKQVGIIREWAFSESPYILAWWGWKRVRSTSDMINLAGPVGAPPTELWTLVITVKDSMTGSAIPGVNIYLNGQFRGQTNTYGQATIANLNPGTYNGSAQKSGYQPATFTVTLG